MKIYIMRHGDAVDRDEAGVSSDEARPLSTQGHEEVTSMARLLDRLGVSPALILSSPLVRARQTADIISQYFGGQTSVTNSLDMAPGGSPAGVLAQILRQGRPAETLLTGHMPDVGLLASYLAWNQRDALIRFRTAGICRIDLPDDSPAPGHGDLRWLIPPRVSERLLEGGD